MSDDLIKAQQRIAELEHIVGGLKSNAKAVARAHADQVQALEEKNTRLQERLAAMAAKCAQCGGGGTVTWPETQTVTVCTECQGSGCGPRPLTPAAASLARALFGTSDNSALRQPPPAANRHEAPGGPIDVAAVEVAVRQPCPPSSVTGAACLLPPGHAADSSTRFHRYPPPPHDSASCPDCGGAAGPPREDR